MAQKIKPNAYRLGITIPWSSKWFFKKSLKFFLEEDCVIRNVIQKAILEAGIAAIDIERSGEKARINIKAAKPGLIIGRGGRGIEDLKNKILAEVKKLRKRNKMLQTPSLNINIEELKRFEISAQVVAQQLAYDIEKRLPYRRVMKRGLETIVQNRDVRGAKIKMGGRLDGAEISRSDSMLKGKMPLSSLRANLDYGEATAYNIYGTVGIKVWIYKGEIFEEKTNKTNRSDKSN